MGLTTVTITGADDNTNIADMIRLSEEFPFTEWGILVSQKQAGGYRFPSSEWISRFVYAVRDVKIKISTHMCGRWVRELLTGDIAWHELPACLMVGQRVQINTHAERQISTLGLIQELSHRQSMYPHLEFIFQWDGVNDHLAYATHGFGIRTSVLFDTSGGAGILPSKWPDPILPFPCGYAGGLGPDNVVAQVEKIEKLRAIRIAGDYWIDMERRVRSNDDSRLEISKVRDVLQAVAPFIGG